MSASSAKPPHGAAAALSTRELLDAEERALSEGHPEREAQGRQGPDETTPREGQLGLAFSGGGIRSATFNLGILQGLAELGLLKKVDYLSTVSGGGYIGGWLQARLYRRYFERRLEALERTQAIDSRSVHGSDLLKRLAELEKGSQAGRTSFATRWRPTSGSLEARLSALERAARHSGADATEPAQVSVLADVEAELAGRSMRGTAQSAGDAAVRFLRDYSNYLTPKTGLFTADTWTVVAIYLRNLLLNLLVLVPALGAFLLLVHALVDAHRRLAEYPQAALLSTTLFGLVAQVLAFLALHRRDVLSKGARESPRRLYVGSVACALLGAFFASALLYSPLPTGVAADLVGIPALRLDRYAVLAFTSALYGLLWGAFSRFSPGRWVGPRDHGLTRIGIASSAGLAAFLALFSFDALPAWIASSPYVPIEALSIFGVPLVLGLIVAEMGLQIGLAGRGMSEYVREWASRLAALLMLWALGLAIVFGLAVHGPWLRDALVSWLDAWVHTLTLGWLLTTAGGIWSARMAGEPGPARRSLIAVAPYVFALGTLIVLSGVVDDLATWLARRMVEAGGEGSGASSWLVISERCFKWGAACPQAPLDPMDASLTAFSYFVLSAVFLGLAVFLSWRVGVNEFSMHALYRNRLVRCYLGSVRENERRADSFTGFDIDDDTVLIDQLCAGRAGKVLKPYPIFNATLNLVVGQKLAWQFRRASSFVFTPLFAGYEPDAYALASAARNAKLSPHGYRPTPDYGGGISLGTAMAISGAAVAPNMGARTSPAMAFLMTLFNVRLGWWLGNPRHTDTWNHSGPTLGLAHLLLELFGKAYDSRRYVYLSDGGHFENLGVYELVRRRCRYIIVCDAGLDAGFEFADLGNAIEKCRVDFGAEIEIDLTPFERDPKTGEARGHCAIGTIRYPSEGPTREIGTLVYIKTALTGCEPRDVLAYARQHPTFPHESTVDQWFDEVQFESYRVLGRESALSVFESVTASAAPSDASAGVELGTEQLFVALRQRFQPRSPFNEAAFSKHAAELIRLHELVRSSQELAFLDPQLFPEWQALRRDRVAAPHPSSGDAGFWLPEDEHALRSGFYLCLQLIQLMENVYLDLRLDETHAHPDNRGWMNQFHRWSWSGMFRVTWAVCASTMGARFQTFCARELDLTVGDAASVQLVFAPSEPALLSRLPADCSNALELNFHERRLLNEISRNPLLAADQPIWRCFAARIEVRDRTSDCVEAKVSFTVGFGVLQHDAAAHEPTCRLVYLRIQDHLRKTGLARRVVEALAEEHLVEGVFPTQDLELSEAIHTEDLARILRSVLEMRPPRRDSATRFHSGAAPKAAE